MAELILIIVSAVFINNFVVVQFLGICPFLGVSKDMKSALGMGLAVTFVMAITCLITYPIYTLILVPLGIEFLEIIVFIFIIAAIRITRIAITTISSIRVKPLNFLFIAVPP